MTNQELDHLNTNITVPEVMTPKFDAKKFAQKYPDIHAAGIGDGGYTYRKAWK